MSDKKYGQLDFDHPTLGFIFEDKLRSVLGGPLIYNPYYRSFNLKGDEKVLDFGCGGGAGSKNLVKFLNRNGHLTCVDTSKYWIKKATNRLERYNNVDIRLGDIRELKIPDFSFDVISIIYVIHDISPTARQGTINALARTLKKGGSLFIREPTRRTHGMPIEEIRKLLSTAGLRETGHETKRSEYIGKFQK